MIAKYVNFKSTEPKKIWKEQLEEKISSTYGAPTSIPRNYLKPKMYL